jgi:hypothetical protein
MIRALVGSGLAGVESLPYREVLIPTASRHPASAKADPTHVGWSYSPTEGAVPGE